MASIKHAIFLSGPIGAGKTTLGRALSERIGGAFIDGDDHSDPGRPWYCSILRTSAAVHRTGLASLDGKPAVVVAYPLNCMAWTYFQRKFEDAGVRPLFVSLTDGPGFAATLARLEAEVRRLMRTQPLQPPC